MRLTSRWLVCLSFVGTLLCTSACGVIRESADATNVDHTNNSKELQDQQYYIWHDEQQDDILRDINTDVSKFNDYTYTIFNRLPQMSITQEEQDKHKIIFALEEKEKTIPTFYKGDALIFYTNTAIPSELKIERYYDYGYTLGIYGLKRIISYTDLYGLIYDNETSGLYLPSSSSQIADYLTEDRSFSVAYVGDERIDTDNISTIGTIKGLKKDSLYDVYTYIGTTRKTFKLTADTHIWGFWETFNVFDSEFLGANILRINLPENLKTGYYYINDVGFFRYVDGYSYDADTDFNDPNIIKSYAGTLIYTPFEEEPELEAKDNDDAINNSKYYTSSFFRAIIGSAGMNVTNENIVIDVSFKNSIESEPTVPRIRYFKYNAAKDDFNECRKNALEYPLTAEQIVAGEVFVVTNADELGLERDDENDTVYIFEVTDIGAYKTHQEYIGVKTNVELQQYLLAREEGKVSAETEDDGHSYDYTTDEVIAGNGASVTGTDTTVTDTINVPDGESALVTVTLSLRGYDATLGQDINFAIDSGSLHLPSAITEEDIANGTKTYRFLANDSVSLRLVNVATSFEDYSVTKSVIADKDVKTLYAYLLLLQSEDRALPEALTNYFAQVENIADLSSLVTSEELEALREEVDLDDLCANFDFASSLFYAGQACGDSALTEYINSVTADSIAAISMHETNVP